MPSLDCNAGPPPAATPRAKPSTEPRVEPRIISGKTAKLRAEKRTGSRKGSRRDGSAHETTMRRVPRQERSRLLVDCIRIAAAEILEKNGPEALTTNNIAARAGVSIGSLYQYFANKEEILEEVFREQADRDFESSRE
jgi:hypothetical protein